MLIVEGRAVSICFALREFDPPLIRKPSFSAICTEVGIEAVNGVTSVDSGVGVAMAIRSEEEAGLFGIRSRLGGIDLAERFIVEGGDAIVTLATEGLDGILEVSAELLSLIKLLNSGLLANLSLIEFELEEEICLSFSIICAN